MMRQYHGSYKIGTIGVVGPHIIAVTTGVMMTQWILEVATRVLHSNHMVHADTVYYWSSQ